MLKNLIVLRSGNIFRQKTTTKPTTTTTSPITPITPSHCSSFNSTACSGHQINNKSQTLLTSKSTFAVDITRTMAQQQQQNSKKHTNRLAKEKSPYLLQHAHNPVDWHPWCDEAIELARKKNKLIFLSVGYSTCHWCHVMEKESFESESVAKFMNENFINIKVDREERPDIDKIYMQLVVMLNGSGGWPMSVWLTPELTPVAAGTYFPPNDRWGMPSFTKILENLASRWSRDPETLKLTGQKIITTMKESLKSNNEKGDAASDNAYHKMDEALRIFQMNFDCVYGGFGKQPKFPQVSRLNFLLHAYAVKKDASIADIVLKTLTHIGRGGIHDHIFGGFARYSVDAVWHIPHFEKMLYDQGQLMAVLSSAYKLTNDEIYLRWADGIFRYITTDLSHPGGGFYSGEDADSYPTHESEEKVEGAFYAWTYDEIRDVIRNNVHTYKSSTYEEVLDIYCNHYDIRKDGNVSPKSDPHGHLKGQNIPIVRESEKFTCERFKIDAEKLQEILSIVNEKLYAQRKQRPRPHLDTKIICAWNGLVLTGLSKLSNCGSPKRAEYLTAAEKLYKFLKENLFDGEKRKLLRSCYGAGTDNTSIDRGDRIEGFLDDYAFLIKGLLDYYKTSLDYTALHWAKELQGIQDALFWDNDKGAYFYSQENAANVIVRLKEDQDGAEPCGNSIAARNLVLLAHYFDDDKDIYKERVKQLFSFFNDPQVPFGYAFPEMLSARMLNELGLDLVAIVGSDTESNEKFIEILRQYYVPGMIVIHLDPENPNEIYSKNILEKFKMINNASTVYVCHDFVCQLPTTDPEKLEQTLKENYFRGTVEFEPQG